MKKLTLGFELILASAGVLGVIARLAYAGLILGLIFLFFSSHNTPMIWLVRKLTS